VRWNSATRSQTLLAVDSRRCVSSWLLTAVFVSFILLFFALPKVCRKKAKQAFKTDGNCGYVEVSNSTLSVIALKNQFELLREVGWIGTIYSIEFLR